MPISNKHIILKNVKLSDIKEQPSNPVLHKNIDDIRSSIERNGYITPIVVDENNIILSGHGRFKALQRMGKDIIPTVLKVEGLTAKQKKDYMISDNKSAENKSWDFDVLAKIASLDELKEMGFNLDSGKGESEEVVQEIMIEPNLEYDYIVVFIKTAEEFAFLQQKLGLKKVRNMKSGKVGIARVVSAGDLIKVMK